MNIIYVRMPKTTKYKDVDTELLAISNVKTFNMGLDECKKIDMTYDGKKLHMIFPKLFAPFGLSQYPKPEAVTGKTKVKYHVNLNFYGEKDGFDKHPNIEECYEKCREIDDKIIELLLEKSGDILNQATNEYSIIDNMYARIIQKPSNAEYDASFKMKMTTPFNNSNEFTASIYNKKDRNKKMKLAPYQLKEYLTKRKWIKPVTKLDCLYYIKGKIYPSIEAYQLMVYDDEEKKKGKDKEEFI